MENRLQYPALALIAVAATNGLMVIVSVFAEINFQFEKQVPYSASRSAMLGYYFGRILSIVVLVIGAIATPLIINGALEMMNGTGYKKARRAAILAMIPGTSLCCIFGMPIGYWALAVLNDPEVKAHFGEDQPSSS
jgi:hypothetical protein